MAKFKLGIIGLGMAVEPHARALIDLRDQIEVVAAFSPSDARRRAFSARFDFPLCDSLDALLKNDSIDGVLVLTQYASGNCAPLRNGGQACFT